MAGWRALDMMRATLLACLAACRALPPPPALPPHAGTEPEREGATTALVVVGIAGQILGGGGWGTALRIEHQTTERTTLGIELTGGRGTEKLVDDSRHEFRQWLLGARVYGRSLVTRSDHDLAGTYGLGLSLMGSGTVTASIHGGVMFSYPNGSFVPVGALGVALAVPLRRGFAYGDAPFDVNFGEVAPPRHDADPFKLPGSTLHRPRTELFVALDLGFLVPLGATGNRLSGDVGLAYATQDNNLVVSLSAADAQR